MRLLLDTHVLIWWFLDQRQLSPAAREAIGDERNGAFVSAASLFEISTKQRSGKLPNVGPLLEEIEPRLAEQLFEALPITIRHGARADALAGTHKDPFDRMLAAQALAEGLTLVSADAALDQFGVRRLW